MLVKAALLVLGHPPIATQNPPSAAPANITIMLSVTTVVIPALTEDVVIVPQENI